MVTTNIVRAITFVRCGRNDIGNVANPAKNVVLLPKGQAPTAGIFSLRHRCRSTWYVVERAVGVVRDGGANRLTRCLANMPYSKRRPSSPSNPSGR